MAIYNPPPIPKEKFVSGKGLGGVKKVRWRWGEGLACRSVLIKTCTEYVIVTIDSILVQVSLV